MARSRGGSGDPPLTTRERYVRARALILADFGDLDGAERLLARVIQAHPASALAEEMRFVQDARAGIRRRDYASTRSPVQHPDWTVVEFTQIDRQHDHHVAVMRTAQICTAVPIAVLGALVLGRFVGGFGALALVAALGGLLLRRTRQPGVGAVLLAMARARPSLAALSVVTLLTAGTTLMLTARVLSGRPVPVLALSAGLASWGLLALAWRWSQLLCSPAAVRAEHLALSRVDNPIATTPNYANWRGPSAIASLLTGIVGDSVLHATGSPYTGIALVATGAVQLPDALTWHARRRRSESRGGFAQGSTGTADAVCASMPPALIIVGPALARLG